MTTTNKMIIKVYSPNKGTFEWDDIHQKYKATWNCGSVTYWTKEDVEKKLEDGSFVQVSDSDIKGFKFTGPGMMGLVYEAKPTGENFYVERLGITWTKPTERLEFSREMVLDKLISGEWRRVLDEAVKTTLEEILEKSEYLRL